MTATVFICPNCGDDDIWPEKDRRRQEQWEVFGLLECSECGEKFSRPATKDESL